MIARNSEDTVKNILGESLKKSLKNILKLMMSLKKKMTWI